MSITSKWKISWCVAGVLLSGVLGCQSGGLDKTMREPDVAATQPGGRDLDRENVQVTRRLSTLGRLTIRIYEQADGQIVVDERQTFDRPGLRQYLSRQDPRRLRQGIVYFICPGDIKDKATFVAVKGFCIEKNVDLYVGEGGWVERKPFWMISGLDAEVAWIVKSRP